MLEDIAHGPERLLKFPRDTQFYRNLMQDGKEFASGCDLRSGHEAVAS